MNKQSTDAEFLTILSKCHMEPEDISFRDVSDRVYHILEEKCYGKRVAMWGVGDIRYRDDILPSKFMDRYAYMFQKAVCIVDINKAYEKMELRGLPIIIPESLPDYDPEIILITSFYKRREIREMCVGMFPGIPCLDVYEELERQGIDMSINIFFENFGYMNLYDAKHEYEFCTDFEQKGACLKSLIRKYAYIRDIPSMMKFIREYISNKFSGYRQMEQLEEELEDFLETLKGKVKSNTRDVLLLFLDAFRGDDWYDAETGKFNVLGKLSRESACFVNMNATAPCTYESMYSVVTGKLPMDGDAYEKIQYRVEDFRLVDELYHNGYGIKCYFPNEYTLLENREPVVYRRSVYLAEKLWWILCEMADGDGAYLHFLYSMELHYPFVCGYHTGSPRLKPEPDRGETPHEAAGKAEQQHRDCLAYVDLLLGFFLQFINGKVLKVLFSDHSVKLYDGAGMKPFYMYYADISSSVHNVCMISGEGISPQVIRKLTSMKDFNDIVLSAYRERKVRIPNSKVIQYQYYPVLNRSLREQAKEIVSADRYIDGINCYRNDKFLVVYLPEGEEVYRIDGDKAKICDIEEAAEFLAEIGNSDRKPHAQPGKQEKINEKNIHFRFGKREKLS